MNRHITTTTICLRTASPARTAAAFRGAIVMLGGAVTRGPVDPEEEVGQVP